MASSESAFQAKFIAWLDRRRIPNINTSGGMGKTMSGTIIRYKKGYSDMLVFQKGQTLFIELKAGTKYGVNENQHEKFQLLGLNGFKENCFVFSADKWEDFKKLAKNIWDIKEMLKELHCEYWRFKKE